MNVSQKGNEVIAMDVARDDTELLVVTENGYGKRTPITDYPVKGFYDSKDPQLIFDLLEAHGVSWKIYSDGHAGFLHVPPLSGVAFPP